MTPAFIQFEKAAYELKEHILSNLEIENTLSALKKAAPITPHEHKLISAFEKSEAISRRKRFEYNSFIISICGIFENFVEELIWSYLDALRATYSRYSMLSEKIRNEHLKLSIDLIGRIKHSRFRNAIDHPTIIRRLNSCLMNGRHFEFNHEAVVTHWANFKSPVLEEYFFRVDILNISRKIVSDGAIKEFLSDKSLSYTGLDLLDDIMDIRNAVAHGDVCEVMEKNLQIIYIDYILLVGKKLYEIVLSEAVCHEARRSGRKMSKFLTIYKKRIACFRPTPRNLCINDVFVVEFTSGIWRKSRILGLQADGVSVESACRGDERGIGIELEFDVQAGCSFYVIAGKPAVAPLPPASLPLVEELSGDMGAEDEMMTEAPTSPPA